MPRPADRDTRYAAVQAQLIAAYRAGAGLDELCARFHFNKGWLGRQLAADMPDYRIVRDAHKALGAAWRVPKNAPTPAPQGPRVVRWPAESKRLSAEERAATEARLTRLVASGWFSCAST